MTDSDTRVRPGTMFNFGTVLKGNKQQPRYDVQRVSDRTAIRIAAQMKQIARKALTRTDRDWLDKPIPRMYLQPYE